LDITKLFLRVFIGPGRVCAADALATTMKDDQISTVRTAHASPSALGESFMRGMINPPLFQSLSSLEIETNQQSSRALFDDAV
jgi:hypothetical protein